ncbi:hypothetical protein D9615_010420 [Tricholomella constricta]|uniref:Uncharacterized protein n=1 Tax=Tricholomella constricta TaxID=117010 RepID=A0A8H5GQC7_9AGAR|nr:hypothetical protein D9615_010420 [Tricholomella constricta]
MMFAFTILCVSFFVSLVHAIPLSTRDVFSPHITSPDENTIWPVGTKQMVTWETKDIPPDSQLTNPNGKVVLGHLGPTGGLNLQLDNPLAQNFKLRVGKVEITVPSVAPRDDYIIVLFGDSGNASPAFIITGITGGSNSTTSSEPTTTTQHSATSITSSISAAPGESTATTPTPSNAPTTSVDLVSSDSTASPLSTETVPSSTSQAVTGTAAAALTTASNAAWASRVLGPRTTAGITAFVLTYLICM